MWKNPGNSSTAARFSVTQPSTRSCYFTVGSVTVLQFILYDSLCIRTLEKPQKIAVRICLLASLAVLRHLPPLFAHLYVLSRLPVIPSNCEPTLFNRQSDFDEIAVNPPGASSALQSTSFRRYGQTSYEPLLHALHLACRAN